MIKKNKSVLYIGGFELPDKNAAAHRVLANAKLFSKLGYDVSFIGVNRDDKNIKQIKYVHSIDGFNFNTWNQVYPKTYFDWLQFLTNISLVRRIVREEFKNDLDIIVVYNYPSFALIQLMFFCKKHNINLISDVTEWYQPEGKLIFKIIKSFDSFLRMRILNKKIDGIIVISKYLFDYYKKNNIIQLPPLVDKKSAKWNGLLSNESSFIKIVYAGSIGNSKKDRLDYVFLALSRIKFKVRDFTIFIIGITKDEYLTIFGVDSIPKNILDCITFKGRKTHEETIEIIKEADYSLFLRDNNFVNTAGFPTKLVESISCSVPVLTNSSSNIEDFLKNEELGFLLDISTNESLDTSLIKAINQNIEKIDYMKQKCFLFHKFHYEYYDKKMEQFLNNLKV